MAKFRSNMLFMIILTNEILWRSQKVGIKFGIMKKFQLINAWPTPEVFSLRMTIQSLENLGLRMSVTLNKQKVLENIWFYFLCACSPLEWKVMNYDKRFWNMSNKPIKTQQCYIQYSVNCTDIFLPVCFVG